MFFAPHFVRDYRRMVRRFSSQYDRAAAMERAVGGDYEFVGGKQAQLLQSLGLSDGHYLIDVACGAGRTAFALRHMNLRYLGTDVVPDLLSYAREKVARPDWHFELVEGLTVPEKDMQADFISMFSLLTHLSEREGRQYLTDALRVLKPGGKVVASFLDAGLEQHRRVLGSVVEQIINRVRGDSVKNVALRRDQIERWSTVLGTGVKLFGPEQIGQSYAVFTK